MKAFQHLPEGAWTVVQYVRPFRGLSVADAVFTAVNQRAADVYGVASPVDLVGRYISEFRPHSDHMAGQAHSMLRQRNIPTESNYAGVIQRPDGELVLTTKTTYHLVGAGVRGSQHQHPAWQTTGSRKRIARRLAENIR